MEILLTEAMRAGVAGLSSSEAPTHWDLDDRPVLSRVAAHSEVMSVAAALGRIGKGSIGYLHSSAALYGMNDEDEEFFLALARAAGVPVICRASVAARK